MTETSTLAPPVVRDDLTADEYHADRTSISSTGLLELLDPGCQLSSSTTGTTRGP